MRAILLKYFFSAIEADARAKMLIYLVENGLWAIEPSQGV
jgi:hypothetical protein